MATRPRVLGTTPVLLVADLARALRFAREVLGFGEPSVWGDPPCFAMLHRDGFELMLNSAGSDGPRPNRNGVWDVYVRVQDVAAEVAAIRSAGGSLDKGPTDTFYAMREVEVVDPDGYRWCLAQDTSTEPLRADETYTGTLDLGTRKLRLVLKLAQIAPGEWRAQVDSPDQNASNLPVDRVTRGAADLHFEMRALGASYAGKFANDGQQIVGQWTQRGQSWPLAWRRE